MFVVDGGRRFVIPRTELVYPGQIMKLHRSAADPVKSPVDHVMADLEETGDMIDDTTIRIALMDAAKGVQAGMVEGAWLAEQAARSHALTGRDILEVMRRVA